MVPVSLRRRKAKPTRPQIALLVDGDNVPPEILEPLLVHLGELGAVAQRKIYRNWRSTRDSQKWDEGAKQHSFERVDRYRTATGKNGSDIAIAVAAMDLLHDGGYDRFCIASGDTDFAPLVERLRRGGAHVTTIGHHTDGGVMAEVSDEYLTWQSLAPKITAPRPASTGRSRRRSPSPERAKPRQPDTPKPKATPAKPAGRTAKKAPAKAAKPKAPAPTKKPDAPKPGAATKRPQTPAQKAKLEAVLIDAFEVARTDGLVDEAGWAPIRRMGDVARTVDADFSPQTYGVASRTPLHRIFERVSGSFEVRKDTKGPQPQYFVRRRS